MKKKNYRKGANKKTRRIQFQATPAMSAAIRKLVKDNQSVGINLTESIVCQIALARYLIDIKRVEPSNEFNNLICG